MPDYRQQSTGTLGTATACASCYTAIQLYYSNIDANDLCCVQSTTATYYLAPGVASFTAATTIYSDDIGIVASGGFYRE